MNCLKCGKKTTDEQVFCDTCLSSMDAYPVKPNVHIHLPNHPTASSAKKSGRKRRALTPEEQNIVYRYQVRRLRVLALLLIVLLGIMGAMLTRKAAIPEDTEPSKNYTSVNPFG